MPLYLVLDPCGIFVGEDEDRSNTYIFKALQKINGLICILPFQDLSSGTCKNFSAGFFCYVAGQIPIKNKKGYVSEVDQASRLRKGSQWYDVTSGRLDFISNRS